MNMRRKEIDPEAGLAIAAILFVVALLGILTAVLVAGSSDFSTAGSADRISANIAAQAALIRNTINQCNIQYNADLSLCQSANAGQSTPPCTMTPASDPYPQSGVNGTAVGSLLCDPLGTQSLWTQTRFPQVPAGFAEWFYMDAESSGGGRCAWVQPTPIGPDYSGRNDIVSGLTKASLKFSTGTTYGPATETIYDPASASQKFVIWITMPTGTPDSHCLP